MEILCEWGEEMIKFFKHMIQAGKDILVLLRREFYCFGGGKYIRLISCHILTYACYNRYLKSIISLIFLIKLQHVLKSLASLSQ